MNPITKAITKESCPICRLEMEFAWETQDIPHFGEAMLIAGVCTCGFRHSDTILLSQKEPAKYTLDVRSLEDLDARVIRSSSGTIRIPELGIDVEPGAASESYVSNVEGVLDRIRGIVEFATRSAREAGAKEETSKGDAILRSIDLCREGKFPITLIIEDPLGNSAIASDRAVRSGLSDEEIVNLKTGTIILDL